MSPSGTPCITHTITWFWVAYTAPLWGARQVPWGTQAHTPPTTNRTDEEGHNLRRLTKGRSETAGSGSSEERMDLGDNVETRQQ